MMYIIRILTHAQGKEHVLGVYQPLRIYSYTCMFMLLILRKKNC